MKKRQRKKNVKTYLRYLNNIINEHRKYYMKKQKVCFENYNAFYHEDHIRLHIDSVKRIMGAG